MIQMETEIKGQNFKNKYLLCLKLLKKDMNIFYGQELDNSICEYFCDKDFA
jgi:hypothetical protein